MTPAERRNPVLQLRAVAELRDLDPETRAILVGLLLEIRAAGRANAERCWRRNKGPMAAYWKAVGVYAGHIARAIR